MMTRSGLAILFSWLCVLNGFAAAENASERKAAASALTADFRLVTGDVVVFIGGTSTVGDTQAGYLETLLTSRFAGQNLRFRNLGWEGDTVFRQDRPRNFGDLSKHVRELGVTVIFTNFGLMESLRGESGLPEFIAAYQRLLDELSRTTPRIVLCTPIRREDYSWLSSETEAANEAANRNLRLYVDAVRKLAAQRGCSYINWFDGGWNFQGQVVNGLGNIVSGVEAVFPMTRNGIHLSDYGYWCSGLAGERALGLSSREVRVEIDGGKMRASGTKLSGFKNGAHGIRFQLLDDMLPSCRFMLAGMKSSSGDRPMVAIHREVSIKNLPSGNYELRIDGQVAATGSHTEWAKGVALLAGPEYDQAERLRALIVEKNTAFFNFWRPQNWEFLDGELIDQPSSRRHDDRAVRWFPEEIKKFLPLIAEKEAEIAKLAVPVTRIYELVKVK